MHGRVRFPSACDLQTEGEMLRFSSGRRGGRFPIEYIVVIKLSSLIRYIYYILQRCERRLAAPFCREAGAEERACRRHREHAGEHRVRGRVQSGQDVWRRQHAAAAGAMAGRPLDRRRSLIHRGGQRTQVYIGQGMAVRVSVHVEMSPSREITGVTNGISMNAILTLFA